MRAIDENEFPTLQTIDLVQLDSITGGEALHINWPSVASHAAQGAMAGMGTGGVIAHHMGRHPLRHVAGVAIGAAVGAVGAGSWELLNQVASWGASPSSAAAKR